MKSAELLRFALLMLLAAVAPAAWAQDSGTGATAGVTAAAAPAGAAGVSATPAVPIATAAAAPASVPAVASNGAALVVRERTIAARFSREKPVLGLPLGSSIARAHCSTDGTAFYDVATTDSLAGQRLYGITPDGEVKHLLRKLPIDYTHILVRDFFVGDKQLVTLLEADKRDKDTDPSPQRGTDYFLSLEDEAGDQSDLVPMSVRFKPVKVARFASGDVMVLGWDEGNLLPVLAMVKGDGTPGRFVDLDAVRPGAPRDANGNPAGSEAAMQLATLESLQGATFVAYGSEILLTWPGTTKPIVALNYSGEARMIPITIPSGYVLNDVLVSSGGRGTLVVRVKEADVRTKPVADEAAARPRMKLIEDDAVHGSFIRTITFDKPQVSDLANSSLTAVFLDTVPDASQPAANGGATDAAAGVPTQLVVATARR
jgi:hypothetical protein